MLALQRFKITEPSCKHGEYE